MGLPEQSMVHEKAITERDFFFPCLKICCDQNMIALFTFWQGRVPFFLRWKGGVCNNFSDNFSHDRSDTSHKSHPSSRAAWMSTAEPRQEINTLEVLNTTEILNLNIGKMWNKPGYFSPQQWPSFFSQLESWLEIFKMSVLRKKPKKTQHFLWLLPEIFG